MNYKVKDKKLFSRGLEHLLKAPSKAVAEKVFNLVFSSRNEPSSVCEETLAELLDISYTAAHELFESLVECISVALYNSSEGLQALADLFEEKAPDIDRKLKQLIGQIINSKLETYREAAYISRASLPHLVDIDWFVNVQRSSSEIPDMQVPSVILQLGIAEEQLSIQSLPKTKKVSIELTKETLDTMLEGLGSIRDQLSAMK